MVSIASVASSSIQHDVPLVNDCPIQSRIYTASVRPGLILRSSKCGSFRFLTTEMARDEMLDLRLQNYSHTNGRCHGGFPLRFILNLEWIAKQRWQNGAALHKTRTIGLSTKHPHSKCRLQRTTTTGAMLTFLGYVPVALSPSALPQYTRCLSTASLRRRQENVCHRTRCER